MKDAKNILKYVLSIVLVICATIVLLRAYDGVQKNKSISEVTLKAQLAPIAELNSYEYEYTTIGKFESYTDFYGWKVPFTTSKFIVTYEGIIKAGFNFDDLKISVNGKNIDIIIPQISITSHEIFYDTLEVYDEQKSIFNPISISDFNGFYADNAKQMETKAINAGLLAKAKTNSIGILENFLMTIVGEGYTITIK